MYKAALALILMAFVACSVRADEIETVVSQYLDAMQYEDYDAAARLFDGEGVKEFRQSMAFMGDVEVNRRQEVYEQMFGPWASQESVEKMSDAEFFASVFDFAMRQSIGRAGLTISNSEYLGFVPEGESIAHAVTRVTIAVAGMELTSMDVKSLVRRNGSWKLQVSQDIEQVATNLRRAVGQ